MRGDRDLQLIQRRGRWSCDQSVKRYQQTSRLHVVYARLPPAVLDLAVRVEQHFFKLLSSRPRVAKPFVAGAQAVPTAEPLGEE